MVRKWKDFDKILGEIHIPHPNVFGIFGQFSIFNRKDLCNDFWCITRIAVKFEQMVHFFFFLWLKQLLGTKTKEKTFGSKKCFWTPSQRKLEKKTGKTPKMANFRPKNVQIWPEIHSNHFFLLEYGRTRRKIIDYGKKIVFEHFFSRFWALFGSFFSHLLQFGPPFGGYLTF